MDLLKTTRRGLEQAVRANSDAFKDFRQVPFMCREAECDERR